MYVGELGDISVDEFKSDTCTSEAEITDSDSDRTVYIQLYNVCRQDVSFFSVNAQGTAAGCHLVC
jgi:hypothetical protein